MFSRAAFAALFTLSLPVFSAAQIDSEGMGDLDAWGARYLAADEAEFPLNLWSGSDDEALLALMQATRTTNLTPAERMLLRRVVLSPTRKPTGDLAEALLAQRARLMLELGEADAAADLAPRLQQSARGLDAETIAVDLDLARGREAAACDRLSGPVPETEYWLKLRAVCAVLRENFAGAELAVEFASAQGLDDPWFIEAIFAASGDTPNPPNARFDTGMNIALSSKANLDTSSVTLSASRPDLAAAAANRSGVPTILRAQLAQIASEADLISPAARREILGAQMDEADFTASSAIELVLQTLANPKIDPQLKAEQLADVLENAAHSGMAHYAGTAQLFHKDVKRLLKADGTTTYALPFARAALAAGDGGLALKWLAKFDVEGLEEQPDPFEIAMLEAVDLITGGDNSPASQDAIQSRLINSAETEAQVEMTARILTAWTGFGMPLGAHARGFMVQQADSGVNIEPFTLLAIESAAQSDALGEAALIILAQTKGAPEKLTSSDLASLIGVLHAIDADDIAAGLAMEASEFWKRPDPQSD